MGYIPNYMRIKFSFFGGGRSEGYLSLLGGGGGDIFLVIILIILCKFKIFPEWSGLSDPLL